MGRPGLTKNRKFLRLVRELQPSCKGFAEHVARGALETLWEAAYEKGDDYLGDESDVEAAARWTGKPGVFCRALLLAGGEGEIGFIEELPQRVGHFVIHDLFDHAPGYVKKRMEREAERIKKGKTISDVRREAAAKRHMQTDASGIHLQKNGMQTAANGTPPSPTPAPTPSPTPKQDHKPVAAQKAALATRPPDDDDPPEKGPTVTTRKAYFAAYEKRWGATPTADGVGNRRMNALLAQFVERVGKQEAPEIAAFYVSHNDALYLRSKHALNLLVRDAEKLRTEWATGQAMTGAQARQLERTEGNVEGWSSLLKEKIG